MCSVNEVWWDNGVCALAALSGLVLALGWSISHHLSGKGSWLPASLPTYIGPGLCPICSSPSLPSDYYTCPQCGLPWAKGRPGIRHAPTGVSGWSTAAPSPLWAGDAELYSLAGAQWWWRWELRDSFSSLAHLNTKHILECRLHTPGESYVYQELNDGPTGSTRCLREEYSMLEEMCP